MKNIFKSIGWSILYFIISFLVQLGFMLVGVSNGLENEEMLNQFAINNNLLLTIFSNIVAILILGSIWNVKRKKSKQSEENSNKEKKKTYVLQVLIAFLYSILFLIITYNIYFEGTNDMIISMNYFNGKNQFLGLLLYASSIMIFAPIAEELLCRGIIVNELNKKFSESKSIIIAAVIFGVMHLMAGGVILAIGAIIMGIILGIVYNTTKSLKSTIFVHSIGNFADIIFLLFNNKINNDSLIVSGIIITIALIYVLKLYYKNIKGEKNKI